MLWDMLWDIMICDSSRGHQHQYQADLTFLANNFHRCSNLPLEILNFFCEPSLIERMLKKLYGGWGHRIEKKFDVLLVFNKCLNAIFLT